MGCVRLGLQPLSLGGELEVKLTGLGDATSTVVGATEILKRQEGMVSVCHKQD